MDATTCLAFYFPCLGPSSAYGVQADCPGTNQNAVLTFNPKTRKEMAKLWLIIHFISVPHRSPKFETLLSYTRSWSTFSNQIRHSQDSELLTIT